MGYGSCALRSCRIACFPLEARNRAMPLIRIFSETYYEMYRHRKSTLTLYCAEFACGAYEGLIALVLPFRRGADPSKPGAAEP